MKKEGRKRLFSNKSKKSQLTIFVIIAIAIVAVIIIAFYPQIKNIFIPPAVDPVHPPTNMRRKRKTKENPPHDLKSAVVNPVVEAIETAANVPCRRAVK